MAETAVVTLIQRLGSALRLNIHRHTLVPDGAWHLVNGKARFHRTPASTDADIEQLVGGLVNVGAALFGTRHQYTAELRVPL